MFTSILESIQSPQSKLPEGNILHEPSLTYIKMEDAVSPICRAVNGFVPAQQHLNDFEIRIIAGGKDTLKTFARCEIIPGLSLPLASVRSLLVAYHENHVTTMSTRLTSLMTSLREAVGGLQNSIRRSIITGDPAMYLHLS